MSWSRPSHRGETGSLFLIRSKGQMSRTAATRMSAENCRSEVMVSSCFGVPSCCLPLAFGGQAEGEEARRPPGIGESPDFVRSLAAFRMSVNEAQA